MSWELVYIISGLAMLPILIFAVIASINVHTVIDRFHRVPVTGNLTGKDLVMRIAQENQLNIGVEEAAGGAGDHYDPHAKMVRLTAKVLNGTSVSALAIAAHECGHALQDAQSYLPLKVRNFVIGLSNFSSRLLTPLIIISFFATLLTAGLAIEMMKWALLSFCIIYGLSALISFITLPTEFDASRRGMKMLEDLHIIETKAERRGVRKVLSAAANTYVISFAMSLVYFLRYLSYFMMAFGRKRR
ncbi:MAG: zinc metallopeptidase [Clostridia bacterium]|nr:zinc metallopeptidase [Clostridia bacterium]